MKTNARRALAAFAALALCVLLSGCVTKVNSAGQVKEMAFTQTDESGRDVGPVTVFVNYGRGGEPAEAVWTWTSDTDGAPAELTLAWDYAGEGEQRKPAVRQTVEKEHSGTVTKRFLSGTSARLEAAFPLDGDEVRCTVFLDDAAADGERILVKNIRINGRPATAGERTAAEAAAKEIYGGQTAAELYGEMQEKAEQTLSLLQWAQDYYDSACAAVEPSEDEREMLRGVTVTDRGDAWTWEALKTRALRKTEELRQDLQALR